MQNRLGKINDSRNVREIMYNVLRHPKKITDLTEEGQIKMLALIRRYLIQSNDVDAKKTYQLYIRLGYVPDEEEENLLNFFRGFFEMCETLIQFDLEYDVDNLRKYVAACMNEMNDIPILMEFGDYVINIQTFRAFLLIMPPTVEVIQRTLPSDALKLFWESMHCEETLVSGGGHSVLMPRKIVVNQV